jgi:hypothetical protein
MLAVSACVKFLGSYWVVRMCEFDLALRLGTHWLKYKSALRVFKCKSCTVIRKLFSCTIWWLPNSWLRRRVSLKSRIHVQFPTCFGLVHFSTGFWFIKHSWVLGIQLRGKTYLIIIICTSFWSLTFLLLHARQNIFVYAIG